MRFYRLIWVVWPGFLMAAVLEMVVFALIDPADLRSFDGAPLALARTEIYAVAFLIFWAAGTLSSALTTMLARSPFELDRCTLEPVERPVGCPKRAADAGCEC